MVLALLAGLLRTEMWKGPSWGAAARVRTCLLAQCLVVSAAPAGAVVAVLVPACFAGPPVLSAVLVLAPPWMVASWLVE